MKFFRSRPSPDKGQGEVAKATAAGSLRRLAALSLIAAVAVSWLVQFGWLARLETAIADHIAFSEKTVPSGRTVLVVVDEAVIRQTGKYPLDREMLARTLDRLAGTGVRKVHVDSVFNTEEAPEADAKLEKAFSRLGPDRLSLTVLRVSSAAGADLVLPPLERFARHASVTSLGLIFDVDRRVRRVDMAASGQDRSASAWLTDDLAPPTGATMPIDFALDVRRIQRFSLPDVASGMVPAEAFDGADVIVGLTVANPQTVINVPIYGRLSRPEVIALAAETRRSGQPLRSIGQFERIGLAFAGALTFGLLLQHLPTLAGLALLAIGSMGWFMQVGGAQRLLGFGLPLLAPPLAGLMVWQVLRLGESRLAHGLRALYVRLVGVGQNALVMAVEVIGEPAIVFDRRGRIVGGNNAFRALARAGHPEVNDAMRLPLSQLFGEQTACLLAGFDGRMPDRISVSMALAEGGERHFEVSLRAIATVTGAVAIASFADVTAARAREAELTTLAFRDGLTGLSNRIAFLARLTALGANPERVFSILLIDLDGFKQVNDRLGHDAGDVVLAGVAGRLQRLVAGGDMAARLGGDEFAILLKDARADGASEMARRIIDALRTPFDYEGVSAKVGASVGIAVWPEHHADPHEALKLADAAMYAAKRAKPAFAVHAVEGPAPVRVA